MSASVDFTSAAAFQDYIRKFMPDLLTKVYHSFITAMLITPHEGVKGELILTEHLLGTLVQRWKKTFDPTANAIDFKPRKLAVKPWKVDLQIYPQEFETTYLGIARRPGFQPDDLPYEAFILDQVLKKIQSEMETAAWQAVEDATPDDGDPLTELFDGFLEIIADELIAGSITATTTSAHSNTNAVANAEAVHAALAPVYQQELTYMFCSLTFARLYREDYRERYGKYVGTEKVGAMDAIRLDHGNCLLIPTIGMGTSSRLVCTPAANLHYGYDASGDATTIRVEANHRSLDFMIDGKIGFQIGIVHDDILSVNNLT